MDRSGFLAIQRIDSKATPFFFQNLAFSTKRKIPGFGAGPHQYPHLCAFSPRPFLGRLLRARGRNRNSFVKFNAISIILWFRNVGKDEGRPRGSLKTHPLIRQTSLPLFRRLVGRLGLVDVVSCDPLCSVGDRSNRRHLPHRCPVGLRG